MIERTTVEGRQATVAYLDDAFNPVEADAATLIKIIFDDGEIRFAVTKGDDNDADADSDE